MLYRLVDHQGKPLTKLTELVNIVAFGTLQQTRQVMGLAHLQTLCLSYGRAVQAVDPKKLAELITQERYGSFDAVAGQRHPNENIP